MELTNTVVKYYAVAVALCCGLAACGDGAGESDNDVSPPVVSTVVLQAHSVPNTVVLPGRVEPSRTAEVRARVTGIVQDVLYEEGANVEKDQILFRIDPRQREAAFEQAKATLKRAEVTAANNRQIVTRYSGLVEEQAISQQEYDAAIATARGAEADVAQAQAAVDAAQLGLDYTNVTAPISGRTSRARVREGSLVSETEATLLTIIRQTKKVYVNLSQSTSQVLEIRREITEGILTVPDPEQVEVQLALENGTLYNVIGHLDFLDLTVMEQTGAVTLRAEFDNAEEILLPGQFVRATLYIGERPDGLEVPQRAVQLGKSKATVFVVGKDNIAIAQEVELGKLEDKNWQIYSGLKHGDRIIVDGVQKVRAGMPVRLQCDIDKTCDSRADAN